jgi:hypothetical protein
MSNYTVEVIENINILDVVDSNTITLEITSSDNFITFNTPSGYPISATSGILDANRVGSGYLTSNLANFNSSVSGLLPSISGSGYVISSLNNNTYTISVSGLQPAGNYSTVGHSHLVSHITNFSSGVNNVVSGIYAPINNPTFTGTVSGITKSMVGLSNVDNTSDINKPVSTAQALANSGIQSAAASDASTKANNAQNFAIQRSNHTGTQLSSTISNFNSSVSGLLPVINITAGNNISISNNSGNFTINSAATGGGATISNSGVNRLLINDGSTSGIVGQSNLTFNGSLLNVSGSGLFSNNVISSGFIRTGGTSSQFLKADGSIDTNSYGLTSGKLNQFASTSSAELLGIINDETGSGLLVFNNSPTLTGVPLVPTATSGTNTQQIANTEFVRTEISNLVNSAPSTLDTLNELANALGGDNNFATTVTNNLATKANLSGATFTGNVSGPSGNFVSLKVNNVDVSASGHTHTSSDITNFNSAVSGLLPTIANSGDNRLLTSTGSTVGINAESNLTFNGSLLAVSGNLVANTGTINSLNFNNIEDPDLSIRQLAWNNSEGSLAVGLSDTYEMFLGGELHYRVRNNTGSSILAGTAVYATGLTPGGNNRIEIAPKAADGSIREVRFMGLVTENIDNGVNGFTTHFGYIRNIDTRGDAITNGTTNKLWTTGEPSWTEGDILYVHPTVAGKLTKIEPKHSISVAIILNRHQNQGKLFVRPLSYGHLSDNHDVDVSGATNGQFLQYNSTTDYWVPSSSGNFTSLSVNGTEVSISGHTHTSSDITNFNSSVSGLLPSNLVTGSGVTNHIPYWSSTSGLLADSNQLIWDSTNNGLGIGTSSPSGSLDVNGTLYVGTTGVANNLYIRTGQAGVSETALRIRTDTSSNLYLDAANASIKLGNQSADVVISAGNGPITLGNTFSGTFANQYIRFTPMNSERMRITGSGVGIGTTTPSGQLHVIGTGIFSSGVGVGFLAPSGLVAISGGVAIGANYNVTPPTNGMIVQGNIGIGTSTPSGRFNINGGMTSDYTSACFTNDGIATTTHIGVGNSDTRPFLASLGGNLSSSVFGWGFFDRGTEGDFRLSRKGGSTSWIDVLSISRFNGNVGIGTTAPQQLLHVSGNIPSTGNLLRLQNGNPAQKTFVDFRIGSTGNYEDHFFIRRNNVDVFGIDQLNRGIFLENFSVFATKQLQSYNNGNAFIEPQQAASPASSANFRIGYISDANLIFLASFNERMRLTGSGNLGIGTTTPSGQLHVVGTGIFSSGVGIGTVSPSISYALDVVGDVNINGNLLFNSFTEKVVSIGNSSSSQTLSLTSGTVQTCTLTNNCTFTMPTPTAGKSFTMFLNTGSGNYTASFSGVRWADSASPTVTILANKVDLFSFISDGSNWYGSFSQNYG